MDLYYADGDRQIGPINKTQLQDLVKARKINSKTLVWHSGMAKWEELGRVVRRPAAAGAQTESAVAPVRQSACCECRQLIVEEEMLRIRDSWVCPACKPIFIQKVKEGVQAAGVMAYAGFWLRTAAILLDGIILWVINMIVYFPLGFFMAPTLERPGEMVAMQLLVMLLQLAIPAAYATFFVGKYGATPGKMACKINIVTSEGEPVSYARALGRHFATMVSGMVLGIGYFMAAFDEQKRALHDRICDTRVIRR
ncbi:MAG: RDD family protein [Desulfobacterales bacterium]|nr:MAG: RDD family protein [Desulfobacterales bacterium]